MVITNQGVAIQPCFQQAKHMQFYKTGQYVVFIKLGRNMQSKDEIELAVHKAFREVLIEVPSFGFGLAVLVLAHLLTVLLVDGFFLGHSVFYGAHKQTHSE